LIEPIAELCLSFLKLYAHMQTCKRFIDSNNSEAAMNALDEAKSELTGLTSKFSSFSQTTEGVFDILPTEAKTKGSVFVFLKDVKNCSPAVWASLYLSLPPDEGKLEQFDLAIRLVRKVLEHLHQILSSFGRILIKHFKQESTEL
jgi:hypothetical protein